MTVAYMLLTVIQKLYKVILKHSSEIIRSRR